MIEEAAKVGRRPDLVCYRADGPEGLVARQRQAWDPVLAWADDALDARCIVVQGGIVSAARSPRRLWQQRARAGRPRGVPGGSVHSMRIATLTGSALIALAFARGILWVAQPGWQRM